uniref:Uncharacterized protein n=1 Tax=Eutreptiella gymnastica TaxID=73025 RepID=A0A7S1IT37_9EUGL
MSLQQLERLFMSVNQRNVVKVLDLSNTALRGLAAFQALARMVASNTSITDLYLENCHLNDVAGNLLLEALNKNTTLMEVRLDLNDQLSPGVVQAVSLKCLLNSQPTIIRDLLPRLQRNDPTLEELSFNGHPMPKFGWTWDLILKALEANTNVRSLCLSDCQIDCTTVDEVGRMLKVNKGITSVDLSCNTIGTRGAEEFAGLLKDNPRVTNINLRGNQIAVRGARAFITLLRTHDTLLQLDIESNGMDPEVAQKLMDAINLNRGSLVLKRYYYQTLDNDPQCDQIDLAYECLQQKGWVSHAMGLLRFGLCKNTHVRRLHLSSCDIGDAGCQDLASVLAVNRHIDTVNIPDNGITDPGAVLVAKALANNQAVTEVNLSHNNITDVGTATWVQVLQQNNSLTSIILTSNPISEAMLQCVADVLTLNSQPLTVKQALPQLRDNTITELDFSVSVDGLWHTADSGKMVAAVLATNTSLTKLNYRGNSLGPQGAADIAQSLARHPSLLYVDLSENSIQDRGALEVATALAHNMSVTSINMEHNAIGEAGGNALVAVFEDNSIILEMMVEHNKISDTLRADIAWQCNLNKRPKSLKALHLLVKKGMSQPLSLDLASHCYDDESLMMLLKELQKLPDLAKLDLAWNTITGKGARALAGWIGRHKGMMELVLSHCPIGNDGVMALADQLQHNQSITKLNLRSTGMTDAGLTVLVECLQQSNDTITDVDVDLNDISDQAVTDLHTALEMNRQPEAFRQWEPVLFADKPSVKTLDFSKMLSYEKLGDISANILARALMNNHHIFKVNLANNNITQEGCQAIADVLKTNTVIKVLILTNNKFGDVGGQALVSALEQNDTLEHLEVKHCGISAAVMTHLQFLMSLNHCPKVLKSLAMRIENNDPTLTCLDFSRTHEHCSRPFDNHATLELVRLLRTNTHICSIDLSYNQIGQQGAAALATYLKDSQSVQHLNLRGNHVAATGAVFAAALKTNIKLMTLDLSECQVPADVLTDIRAQLAVNQTTPSASTIPKHLKQLNGRRPHPSMYSLEDDSFYHSMEYHRDLEVDILEDAMHDMAVLQSHPQIAARGGYTAAAPGSRLFLLN